MNRWTPYILGIGVAIAMMLALMACTPVQQPSTPRPTHQVAASTDGPDFRFTTDCGGLENAFLTDPSVETLPCVVHNDQGYFLVTSWEPTKMIHLNPCTNEDGGNTPCVWDSAYRHNGTGTPKFMFLVYLED